MLKIVDVLSKKFRELCFVIVMRDNKEKNVFKDILLYTFGIILAAIVRGIFMYLMRQTIIVASRKIEYDLKNEIYYHYQTLPLEFYKNKRHIRTASLVQVRKPIFKSSINSWLNYKDFLKPLTDKLNI